MGEIYFRSKMKQFMYYLKSLFDGKMSMSLSMPVSPTVGTKTLYMGTSTQSYKKGHIYEYQSVPATDNLYAWLYEKDVVYTTSEHPEVGDALYNWQGDEITHYDGYEIVDASDNYITLAPNNDPIDYYRASSLDTCVGKLFAWNGFSNYVGTVYTYNPVPSGIEDGHGEDIFDANGETIEDYQVYSCNPDSGTIAITQDAETYDTGSSSHSNDIFPSTNGWTDISGSEFATKTDLSGKANVATTIAGYGITDAYTKAEVNTALSGKADSATVANKFDEDLAADVEDSYYATKKYNAGDYIICKGNQGTFLFKALEDIASGVKIGSLGNTQFYAWTMASASFSLVGCSSEKSSTDRTPS